MPNEMEKIHPDAGSLGEVIIELNISCRNVAIYPRDHPSIEKFLNQAFNLLQNLFKLRTDITFVIGTVAISDFFDALRSARPYRKGLEIKETLALMKKEVGRAFDPFLLDNFIRRMHKALSDKGEMN